jgi:prepilin-type processing-associated H-X9-DG protein
MKPVPATFVDRAPLRGPFISSDTPPSPYTTAQLLFADGHTYHATWCAPMSNSANGLWWGWCTDQNKFCEVHPIGWRLMEPEHSC